jgi:hypothetical protein
MNFGQAKELMVGAGAKAFRAGWNGKGMWLCYVEQWAAQVDHGGEVKHMLPFIAMKTVDGGLVPWLASQTDLLAHDWQILATKDRAQ